MITVDQLINWDAKEGRFKARFSSPPLKDVLALANHKRHPLIEELVKALSEMWERIGLSSICRKCHAQDQDCCDICVLLGPGRCHAKPLGCAFFICGKGEELVFNTRTPAGRKAYDSFTRWLTKLRYSLGAVGINHTGIRTSGYDHELEWLSRVGPEQEKVLREVINEIRSKVALITR